MRTLNCSLRVFAREARQESSTGEQPVEYVERLGDKLSFGWLAGPVVENVVANVVEFGKQISRGSL
jgi:hypothetical protein